MDGPDRLSALDAAFLDLETERSPLHVGWIMRFAGDAPSLSELRRHVDARLDGMPRLRRRVVVPALGLGDPWWAEDAGFDIARHVHALRLAAPGDEEALRDLAGTLLSAPLEPQRPLWRLTLVTDVGGRGLPRGFAVVGQAHHALLDGSAAVALVGLLLDARSPAPQAAGAARPEGGGSLSATAAGLARAATDGTLRDGAALLAALAAPAGGSAIAASRTRARTLALASTGLNAIRAAAARHEATVNDALLAASALAVGSALERRGEHPARLRALVPVNVRAGDETAAERANRISLLPVGLPLGEPDPVRMLRAVRARTTAAKRSGFAGAGALLLDAADALPRAARPALARAATRAAGIDLVISNVPGPPAPLDLLGRPLLAAWPAVPLLDGQGLSIGAVSYAGRLFVGVNADAKVVPDAERIARDLEAHLAALTQAPAATATTPWRARARARRDARRSA